MSTLTLSSFDTLAYVKRLREADVPEKQAEAQAEALRAALDTQDVVTKGDLRELELKLRNDISLVRSERGGELKTHRWMLGFVLAGVLALILKSFF